MTCLMIAGGMYLLLLALVLVFNHGAHIGGGDGDDG